MSQRVLGPVPAVAAGVAPWATIWSSTSSSISGVGATVTRPVYPEPGVRVSPKPESA